jgi:hypothetical protein
MPSTTEKKFLDRATVSTRGGAGGEPLGEPLVPPAWVFERLPDEMRLKLPDELVDGRRSRMSPGTARHLGPPNATEWMTGASFHARTPSANRHPTTRGP